MTEKEAINQLEGAKMMLFNRNLNEFNIAICMAENALEKQIPHKPAKCNITLGRCKCGVGFMTKETKYCGNCGQRLDWSE